MKGFCFTFFALVVLLSSCAAPIMMAGALPFGAAGSALGLGALAKAATSTGTGAIDKADYVVTIGSDLNAAYKITEGALKTIGAAKVKLEGGILKTSIKGQEVRLEIRPSTTAMTEILIFSSDRGAGLKIAEAIKKVAEAT